MVQSVVVMIVLLIEEINLMQVSLEIVRLRTTKKKKSHEHSFKKKNIYIYIYIYAHTRFATWLRKKKKKILCLLQELFLRFPNLCSMQGKLWVMCDWSCPFIVLDRESLIATHPIKTRLVKKRSPNKEGFLEGIRHCKFLCSNWN